MKKLVLVFLFFVVLYADFVDFEFDYSKSDLSILKVNGYHRISLTGAFETGNPGEPEYLLIPYCIAIPPGNEIENIEIIQMKKSVLEGDYKIFPAQPPRPFTNIPINSEFIPLKEEYLSMEGPYPENIINNVSTGTKAGFQIGMFCVAPILYYPSSSRLEFIEYIKVRVHYKKTYEVFGLHERIVENMGENVKEMVINPEAVDFYKMILKSSPRKLSKALPSGDYAWVVICKKADTTYWKPLIEWKNKKGVRARYYLISDINANYTGANLAEKTKKFIDDAYRTWGTLWFLIGSHKDSLPNAPCYGYVATVPATIDNNIASERFFEDLYRSGVYHDWDDDNDLLYCERTADNPDLLADCYVGRVCVKTSADVENFVNRVLFYERTPVQDYLRKFLFFSEQLWSTNSEGYFHAEQLESKLSTAGVNYLNYHEMYNELGYYPDDDSAVHSMNHGRGWTISYSHGDYITIMQGQLAAKNITVLDLRTIPLSIEGSRWGIHTGICCMSGGYHERDTAYSKVWLVDRSGGVATILNSEYGWGLDQEDTDTSLGNYKLTVGLVFRFVFYSFAFNKWHIGEALARARDRHKAFITSESAEKWSLIEYNLQGDPEMPTWRDTTKTLYASHPATVNTGPGTIIINVYDGTKASISNVTVCIMTKVDTIYRVGTTDLSGNVSFTITPSIENDTLFITATKYESNYKPYEGYALVVLSTASIQFNGFVNGNYINIFGNAPQSFDHFNIYLRGKGEEFKKIIDAVNLRNIKIGPLKEGEYDVFIEGGNNFLKVLSDTLRFNVLPIKPDIYDIKVEKERIKFLFVSDRDTKVSIKIADVTGRVLIEQEREVKSGNNFITIDSKNLKNNIYFLMVNNGKNKFKRKFLKIS